MWTVRSIRAHYWNIRFRGVTVSRPLDLLATREKIFGFACGRGRGLAVWFPAKLATLHFLWRGAGNQSLISFFDRTACARDRIGRA